MTGRLEPTYPSWKRNVLRNFVSGPIIMTCLFLVFVVMILSFQIQVKTSQSSNRTKFFPLVISAPNLDWNQSVTHCITAAVGLPSNKMYLQDWWDAKLESGGYGFWLSYVPKVLLAVVIALMDEAYFKVAVWLNDMGTFCIDPINHLFDPPFILRS